MASIKSQLTLNDGMSGVLRKITAALDTTLRSFEQVQRASERAIDKESIDQARAALVGANKELDYMESNFRQAAEQEEQLNRGIRAGSSSMGSMLSKAKRVVATLASAVGVTKLLNLSDQMASTSARLSFIIDDGGSVEQLERQIMASAQRSRATYLDTVAAVAKLGTNASTAFSGTNEIVAFMEQINKQFVIGGATAREQSAATLQLAQAMAAGALRGEELNSILESAPGIARAIEQYMGAAEGSIRRYAEQGLITTDVVKKALFSVMDETNAKFESMPLTWSQIWTNMQNRALSAMTPILDKLNGIANSPQFQTVTDGLFNGFAAAMYAASGLLDIIINIGSFMVNNWSWIAPIVWGVVAALTAYHGAMLVINTLETISRGIKAVSAASSALKAGATLAEAAATKTAAGAQVGFNAALFACPIVWIIMLIIVLIALFYAAVAAVSKFAGTSVSATGIICGAFMAALAFIGNIFVALWNLVVDVFVLIYNLVAEVANFIGNIFTDPIGAVCRLFFGLADTVLGILQALASAIDAIFGSNLSGAVQGWRDSLGGWVDDTFGQGEEIMAKLNADDMKLGRFEYGAAWDSGYDFGAGIADTVGGMFSFGGESYAGTDDYATGLGYDLGSINDTLGGIGDSAGRTAGNTGSMAESLEISSEQLEYLRDIAEREAINRFTTAEVKIDMTGMTNRIDGSVDLDGVLTELTDGFAEALVVAAEGVHA